MARHGVGKLHLQGIEIGVLLERPVPLALVASEFGPHLVEQPLALLARERRRVALQAVEHNLHVHLHPVVVGELDGDGGKLQAIAPLHLAAHTTHTAHVAIGDEIELVVVGSPKIVVLGHQQQVAAREQLLAVENASADAAVEQRGATIGTRHHDGTRGVAVVVAVRYLLHHIFARNRLDVGKVVEFEVRRSEHRCLHDAAQQRGVVQDAAVLLLTCHLAQPHLIDREAARLQHGVAERGTLQLPHRRQLRHVAHEQQAATLAVIHIVDEVVEQVARAKHRSLGTAVGNHRRLVDEKHGRGVLVVGERETLHAIALLTIDFAVYRVGRMSGIVAKDVRRASRGGQQHARHAMQRHGLDDGAGERCLARAGIAAEQHHRALGSIEQEMGKGRHKEHLLLVGVIGQLLKHRGGEGHHSRVVSAHGGQAVRGVERKRIVHGGGDKSTWPPPISHRIGGHDGWRSDRDSNSGYAFDVYTLSRRASSATRASLHEVFR